MTICKKSIELVMLSVHTIQKRRITPKIGKFGKRSNVEAPWVVGSSIQ
jgi:hypothetical protein